MGLDGPWYAVSLLRKFDLTMGGVTIDEKTAPRVHFFGS